MVQLHTERALNESLGRFKPVDRVWLMTGFGVVLWVLTLVKTVSIMILFTAWYIMFPAMYGL